jgi:hypothetical protein
LKLFVQVSQPGLELVVTTGLCVQGLPCLRKARFRSRDARSSVRKTGPHHSNVVLQLLSPAIVCDLFNRPNELADGRLQPISFRFGSRQLALQSLDDLTRAGRSLVLQGKLTDHQLYSRGRGTLLLERLTQEPDLVDQRIERSAARRQRRLGVNRSRQYTCRDASEYQN